MTDFASEATALTVAVGGRRFALAAGAVRRVGFPGPVTPLPFVPDWIEGLTTIDGQPMLQLDPGRAPASAGSGGPAAAAGSRLVVIETPAGVVALRVDRVEPAGPAAEPLPVANLTGALVAPSDGGMVEISPAAAAETEGVTVLVVAAGGVFAAVLIDDGVSVGEVAASLRVDTGDGPGRLMATIGERLLPARRLSEAGGAGRAVIGPAAEGWTALLVERLIGLESVAPGRLVPLPGAAPGRNLCFTPAGGEPVCLHDFATLAGGRETPGAAYRALLERVRAQRPVAPPGGAGGMGGGGLVVTVRGVRWLLPLTLVERMLGADQRRFGGRSGAQRPGVPLFDAGRWFPSGPSGAGAAPGAEALRLRLADGGRIALGVDRIALETAGNPHPWRPPPALPPGLATLVDAVRAEPATGLWTLRLTAGLKAAALPLSLRRAVARACLGRLTPTKDLQTTLSGDITDALHDQDEAAAGLSRSGPALHRLRDRLHRAHEHAQRPFDRHGGHPDSQHGFHRRPS